MAGRSLFLCPALSSSSQLLSHLVTYLWSPHRCKPPSRVFTFRAVVLSPLQTVLRLALPPFTTTRPEIDAVARLSLSQIALDENCAIIRQQGWVRVKVGTAY